MQTVYKQHARSTQMQTACKHCVADMSTACKQCGSRYAKQYARSMETGLQNSMVNDFGKF